MTNLAAEPTYIITNITTNITTNMYMTYTNMPPSNFLQTLYSGIEYLSYTAEPKAYLLTGLLLGVFLSVSVAYLAKLK